MSQELDPSEFVQRIRQLGAERDQEDAERVRKLEEEIIQGRSERLARRAERARSLSPDKPTTPQSQPLRSAAADAPSSVREKAADTPTPVMDLPEQQSARDDSLQRLTGSPAHDLEDTAPKKPTPSAAVLGRSGTLSWQQRRPQSSSGRRPLSMAAPPAEKMARDPSEPSSPADLSLSRNQIVQSLASKDPTWFRQTPDRGFGSAAYRRNPEDNASDVGSVSGKKQLPGMSRDSTAEPEATSPPPETVRSSSPSHAGSVRVSTALSNRFSANTSISGGDTEPSKVRSPLPMLDSQKFAPPSEQGSSGDGGDQSSAARALAMSPTQGRISPERTDRPASPTKGMGGFVQSAMLKRSDSVSKRWSSQVPQGLSRQNSTLSNRGTAAPSGFGSVSKADSRPTSLSRDHSMEPSSRPGSSSSNLTVTRDVAERDSAPKPEFIKPALPYHSRSKSVASTFSEDTRPTDETSPPSPSKRWSPTKSSWLESALNKPDSPKLKLPPPQQPAWMTEINRMKQQRGSIDLGKGGNPFQGPSGEPTSSGRSSPIKDVQLKPVSLRRAQSPNKEEVAEQVQPRPLESRKPESPKKDEAVHEVQPKPLSFRKPASPKKEESAEQIQPSPKPKPVLSPKPSILVPGDKKPGDKPVPSKDPVESMQEKPVIASPQPQPPVAQQPKDTPPAVLATSSKPEAPLKDFRAILKSRQPTSDASTKNEANEFQNVFGRLKKTETKNYVAPDTLKGNILRGKQALNNTGGPKPSARRDEFRDSLVSKKAAMLAKAQESGSAAHKRADSSNQETAAPEAIAKRKELGRSDSFPKSLPLSSDTEAAPEAIAQKQSLRTNQSVVPEKQAQPAFAATSSKEPVRSSKLAERFNPALAGILARGPPSVAANGAASEGSTIEDKTKNSRVGNEVPAPELTHITKGRARGPKRRAPATKQATAPTEKLPEQLPEKLPEKVATLAAVPLVKDEDVVLSKVPKTDQISEEPPMIRTPARESLRAKPATPMKSPELSRKLERTPSPEISRKLVKSPSPKLPRKPASLELGRRVSSGTKSITPKTTVQSEPVESPKPSPSARVSIIRSSRPLPTPPAKPVSQLDQSSVLKEIPPPNAGVSPVKDVSSPEKSVFSVKSATALWGRQSATPSPAPTKTKSPIKLPTKADEQAAMDNAGLNRLEEPVEPAPQKPRAPKRKPAGLGFGSLGSFAGLSSLVGARSRESTPPQPLSARQFPISPPASGDRPQSEPFKAHPMPAKSDGMFAEFFDEAPVTSADLPESINTVQILQNPPLDLGPSGKIKTLKKQVQEITGDGKLAPVPTQEEHILFQDSMYICIHIFADAKEAKTSEVYLWAGNGVAEPTLEDVMIFGRNIAKQNQGKLVVIRQGKETPNFFEALGGIVITRRGSRPAHKEYILCGRRHLGHIAFDEVDFKLNSLCSGFPYIISTQSGKVFLWKGRGCSAEELSGARLMGMDLTPNGDFVEVDEGAEPLTLFNVFPPTDPSSKGPAIPRSADHWRYKATSANYRARLFKMEQHTSSGWGPGLQVSSFFAPLLRRPSWQSYPFASSPAPDNKPTERPQTPGTPKSPETITTKVVEIMPFTQRDLEPEHIYVLDAFFEVYIIVGSLSRTQAAAFSTALLFAQEYLLLAVSEEDRPFMPVATVVLEGVPRDLKAVFRCWDDAMVPAANLMQGKLGRGKSLRIVGLGKAMEGTRL
ncbi:hypothetical protein BDV95DRAFT_269150 [Massariosphaeria phaeospora]|uniref:Uncharacterized protein n=1 Tax=Massariosphaeria phaeospora TaxID=100035 RepID=A0A7C8M6C3_9PLEO|nr:hypothetical protein BDV95DRAFT_269150 [Massariosphaeria phaeospora]